jgi:hypothetical protein
MQNASPKSAQLSNEAPESNSAALKPCSINSRFTPMRIDGSSSTTKIELRVDKIFGLRVLNDFARARFSAGSKNTGRPKILDDHGWTTLSVDKRESLSRSWLIILNRLSYCPSVQDCRT